MPRKKKIKQKYMQRAVHMLDLRETTKRQIETAPISGHRTDNENSTPQNQPSQHQYPQLSPRNTSVNETMNMIQILQPQIDEGTIDSTLMETSDTSTTLNDENLNGESLNQVNAPLTPEMNTGPDNIEGRRIINISHFFNKIREVAKHGPLDCGLNFVEIIGEKKVGLFSKYTLQCKLCNEKFYVESDSIDDFNVNQSAVAGMIAVGGGHRQLQEITAALNLPIMKEKLYQQCHAKLSREFEKISIESMNEAAKKEREFAIAEGRVDKNGIPIIDVIVDGCWSKRTYKKNYSALSGAAAIIGKRSGEVLFLGVRNKYCCICSRAEKNDIQPQSHVCYRNYSGPSTGMESDILVEGFKTSIQMHGLIYGRMVSDGDSNTYAKLLKSRPYDHLSVEKIECRNHVLRNLCNKLVQLQTDTKYPLQYRKQLTQKKIMSLRKTILKIIKHHKTDSESERRCRIEPLYNDLLLAHLHAFGEHSRCKKMFCAEIDKPMDQISEAANITFYTSTLWSRICLIMSNVASHAPSLIHDVDSNLVERFNSIVAKHVGGKRTNLSQRGAYETRCQAALVSFNSHKTISSLYKSVQGRSPRGQIKRLERQRLHKLINMRKRQRKKNRRLSSQGHDKNYGSNCEKPDMTAEIFEINKNKFLQELQRSDGERNLIQKETTLQSNCSEWMEIRRTILTASNFGRVVKRRQNVSCANLVKDIIYQDCISHVKSIKHGRDNEKKAIEQLSRQENVKIEPCGLFIDREIPFLGATPDGLVGDDIVVEVKCPITASKEGFLEAIKSGKLTFYKLNKQGVMEINKNHNWYFQIQGQLHIANKSKCLLGIWYADDKPLKTEIVFKDDSFWRNVMKEKLEKFYLNCLLPELVDPRHSRNMPIRDPEYIEQAIKEKQERTKAKKKELPMEIEIVNEDDTRNELNQKTPIDDGPFEINNEVMTNNNFDEEEIRMYEVSIKDNYEITKAKNRELPMEVEMANEHESIRNEISRETPIDDGIYENNNQVLVNTNEEDFVMYKACPNNHYNGNSRELNFSEFYCVFSLFKFLDWVFYNIYLKNNIKYANIKYDHIRI